ncbi:MAG: hypothetical protein AABY22_18255 [Nanoarchaeota archaeon]
MTESLGVCIRCGINEATLVFTESTLAYVHGFTENLCQQCYDKIQKEDPLYKLATSDERKRISKIIDKEIEKRNKGSKKFIQEQLPIRIVLRGLKIDIK